MRHQFIIIKPDAVASGKTDKIIDALKSAGVAVSWAAPIFDFNSHGYEELYRYNIDLDHKKCMVGNVWNLRQPFLLTSPIAALVTSTAEIDTDVYSVTRRLKGDSTPYFSSPGELRFDLNAASKTLNLIHMSDDPLSCLRELQIFLSRAQIRHVFASIATAHRGAEPRFLLKAGQIERWMGPASTDCDIPAAILRLVARLALIARDSSPHFIDEIARIELPRDELGPRQRLDNIISSLRAVREHNRTTLSASVGWRDASATSVIDGLLDHWDWDVTKMSFLLAQAQALNVKADAWDQLMLLSNALYVDAIHLADIGRETVSAPQDIDSTHLKLSGI